MITNGFGERGHQRDPRRRHPGYRKADIDVTRNVECGIYEWKVTKPGMNDRVVYIGSSCQNNQNLSARINVYCQNGSHKKESINLALKYRASLWVRVCPYSPKETARAMEKKYLDRLMVQ